MKRNTEKSSKLFVGNLSSRVLLKSWKNLGN